MTHSLSSAVKCPNCGIANCLAVKVFQRESDIHNPKEGFRESYSTIRGCGRYKNREWVCVETTFPGRTDGEYYFVEGKNGRLLPVADTLPRLKRWIDRDVTAVAE
jgi:hypothetical protein